MRTQLLAAVAAASCVLCGVGRAHETEEGKGQTRQGQLRQRCDAKVQQELQRAVAMLHSFWFSAGEKAFRHVLEDDPAAASRPSASPRS